MGAAAEEFLAEILPRLNEAEIALHNGDAGPRIAMWSRQDPVTLFGAAISAGGWAEIGPAFGRLGSSFSACKSYRNEVIAAGASGDLAYLVAFEHTTASVQAAPQQPYVLRVTTVFRREDCQWKVAHRHGDPASDSAAALARRITPAIAG
jgi:ketosteroid isomerase-like protein